MTDREPDLPSRPRPTHGLAREDRRWLHDKYQALDQNEAELASYRSSFIAVVTTALVAALVYAVANVLPRGHFLFAITVTFLATFGIVISALWAIVLWRTTAAQNLWREAAREMERLAPPVEPSVRISIPMRRGGSLTVDLTRPYTAHQERFSGSANLPWLDRISPAKLSNGLPVILVVTWLVVLAVVWGWYFLGP